MKYLDNFDNITICRDIFEYRKKIFFADTIYRYFRHIESPVVPAYILSK